MPFPGLTFNDMLPPNIRQEFEQFTSLLHGYLGDQHKDNGSHKDVTADSVASTDGYAEHDRSVNLGDWQTVRFLAGNFTASGGNNWTLTSGDQSRFAYTLVGHTMTVAFRFDTTSVSGISATLSVTIPDGYVSAAVNAGTIAFSDNGTLGSGVVAVTAGGTTLNFTKDVAATGTWAVAANTTAIYGTFSFEVS